MTAGAESVPQDDHPSKPAARGWLAAVERFLVRVGDRLNPILVKETRQALKSRHFGIVFSLVLIASWIVSILGLASIGPDVAYAACGPDLFFYYYLILAAALWVIVPFGAFRSLATEQEDRTYELLSITTLKPRQIVSGKLASSALQMLVYLSAIAPCLGFTYMLRGIDVLTMALLLIYVIVGSVGLSAIALFAGTIAREKHWQVVLSVFVIVGLLLACWGAAALCYLILFEEPLPFHMEGFWPMHGFLLTAFVTYFALVFYAAVARITFASDNRSTRLRVVMLVQHVCLVGWFTYAVFWEPASEPFIIFLAMILVHWYVMGALMTGESPELSPRVKRGLPQSSLGRAFLTWFNPGPGTGYLFAVCGALGAVALVGIVLVAMEVVGGWTYVRRWALNDSDRLMAFGVLLAAYLTAYLGVGLLIMRLLHRVGRASIFLAGLVQVVLLAAGCAVPWVIESMAPRTYGYMDDYSLLHATNPFWTLAEIGDSRVLPLETAPLMILVPLAALMIFLINLPGVAREVRQVRVAKPKRVAEEDAERAAKRAPPVPTRTSPWGDY
ncbi:MAG: ABC transporter permease [Planctomycetota bacterium]|jgi:hypothetical protein